MSPTTRIGAYVLGLGVLFVGALGLGDLTGPVGHGGGHDEVEQAAVPRGLQVSQDGFTLEPVRTVDVAGQEGRFAFRVLDRHGAPVTEFTPSHDKEMHLIVVRRDLSGFQHLHPTMAEDGTWSVPMTFPRAGAYRAFADFRPDGAEESLTLGVDVPVAGSYDPRPLPAAARVAAVDGYQVRLDGQLVPGRSSRLRLTVSKDGRPVTDLQPYLAAYGHLVALRKGDLAYLHVHPDGEPGDGRTQAGPEIVFYAEVPSVGDYRLYLDFRHGDVVRTAEFTASAGAAS